MSRENKFRAWYSKSQTWVYFNLQKGFASDHALEIYRELVLNGVQFYEFTGLKDKNGKEIYEGDIVLVKECECLGASADGAEEEWNSCQGEVLFEDCMFVFDGHSAGTLPMSAYKGEFEIIGNIYENPELLTK